MTTHDKDKIIAAAKECYHAYSEWNLDIERFYTIAFEDGRKAGVKEVAELIEIINLARSTK